MSNSPWQAKSVYNQVFDAIRHTPGLESGGVLILDESANEYACEHNAGASKQYNGLL